jgi:hypothetical protein
MDACNREKEKIAKEGEPISADTLSKACRIAEDPRVKSLISEDSIRHALQTSSIRAYFRQWAGPRVLPEQLPIPVSTVEVWG